MAMAFGAAVLLGFFVVGPVLQNAMVDSETVDHSHSNTLGKFALSNARPLSRPSSAMATSAIRTADPEMFGGGKKAAPKKAAPKKAAPKTVAKKAVPKKAAPKRAAPQRVARSFSDPFSFFNNGPGMLQKPKGTDRFLDTKYPRFLPNAESNKDLYFYKSKPGRSVYPYTK